MIIQPLFNTPVHYTTNLGNLNSDSTCLDKAIITGIYFFVGGDSYPNESETSGDWALLVLENEAQILQVAERLGLTDSRIIYSRSYIGNIWSNWTKTGTSLCDSELSTSSSNPIQNKVVAKEINNINTNKLSLSGGTMTGQLKAQANTEYTTYQVRNMAFSTSASTPTGNGSVLGVYT